MQMWHTGDYCTINTSLFSMLSLSNCHRIAIVSMLQKNCVIPPKNEETGMGNRDVKNRIERVLVWAEYIVVCRKIC